MLRNSFLEKYRQKTLSEEIDSELFKQNNEYILSNNRPLSSNKVFNLPIEKLNNFVDEYLLNKDVAKLLYQGNYRNELEKTKHQDKTTKHVTTVIKKVKDPISIAYKITKSKDYASMFKQINEQIKLGKIVNKENERFMRNKNREFYEDIKGQNIRNKKMYYDPMNKIREDSFNRMFNTCSSYIFSTGKFNLPNVGLNVNDVYSRLYHNQVFLDHRKNQSTSVPKRRASITKSDVNNLNSNYTSINANNTKSTNQTNTQINNRYSATTNNNNDLILNENKLDSKNKTNYIKINMHKYKSTGNIFAKRKTSSMNFYNSTNVRKNNIYNLKNILNNIQGKEFTAKINDSMLRKCIMKISCGPKKEFKLIEELFDKEDNVKNDLIEMKDMKDEKGNTYLHKAIIQNNMELVRYFIDKDLNINTQNDDGNTPLHLAMLKKNIDIIKLLLNKGADLTIRNKDKERPFDYSSKDVRDALRLEDIMRDKREFVQ